MSRRVTRVEGDDLALIVAALRDGAHHHRSRKQTAKRMAELADVIEQADLLLVPPVLPLFSVLKRSMRKAS
jgi:hypothetical protein